MPNPLAIRPATSWSFAERPSSCPAARALQQFAQGLDRRQRLHLPAPHERGQVVVVRVSCRRGQVRQQPAAGLLVISRAATHLEAERVLVVDGDRPTPRRPAQRERQPARAEVQDRHAARSVVALGGRPAQPAGLGRPRGVGRMPDIHRLEVRTLRVGIADALQHRELTPVPQRPEALHPGIQADVIVQPDDHVLRLAQRGPRLVIQVVGVGDDGVEPVVAARELQHHQDVVPAGRGRLRRPGHEMRDRRAEGHQRRALQRMGQELTTRKHFARSVIKRDLCQLVLGRRQDGVDGLARDAAAQGRRGDPRPRPRRASLAPRCGRRRVDNDPAARRRWHRDGSPPLPGSRAGSNARGARALRAPRSAPATG